MDINRHRAVAYMLQEIRHICQDMKKRAPGSEGEREAALYMAQKLKTDCGCDEFTILASSFEMDNIGEVFENVVEREVERWNAASNVGYQMSLSVGTASGRLSEESINQLITKADKQMYLAKGSKNAYR